MQSFASFEPLYHALGTMGRYHGLLIMIDPTLDASDPLGQTLILQNSDFIDDCGEREESLDSALERTSAHGRMEILGRFFEMYALLQAEFRRKEHLYDLGALSDDPDANIEPQTLYMDSLIYFDADMNVLSHVLSDAEYHETKTWTLFERTPK